MSNPTDARFVPDPHRTKPNGNYARWFQAKSSGPVLLDTRIFE